MHTYRVPRPAKDWTAHSAARIVPFFPPTFVEKHSTLENVTETTPIDCSTLEIIGPYETAANTCTDKSCLFHY